jgi:excinuclease ABC subunit C
MQQSQIQNTLKNLPSLPGVYRFYGIDDKVLYIGKAINLKNRVSHYFLPSNLKDNHRLQILVEQIDRIDYTVVKTEKEALILEANLIHNLQPKFNIQLKDDKSYLYVRITNSPIPNITLTRRKYDKTSSYFGPYTKKFGIFNVLRTIRLIFPYCENKNQIPGEIGKPCNYVQLKLCDGICCGKESIENYQAKITQIKSILNGNTTEVKNWLKTKISESASISNFELAGLYRDRLGMLDSIISSQKIILPHPQDLDIITLVTETDTTGLQLGSVFVQVIREGKIINVNNFMLTGSADSEGQDATSMIETFMLGYYSDKSDIPEILLQSWESEK